MAEAPGECRLLDLAVAWFPWWRRTSDLAGMLLVLARVPLVLLGSGRSRESG